MIMTATKSTRLSWVVELFDPVLPGFTYMAMSTICQPNHLKVKVKEPFCIP
uniref:Uncharacterized protein n=1 Tax=Arion vulgaris TaxID=1028688 RepID=A0A0B6ZXE4_9EUPU